MVAEILLPDLVKQTSQDHQMYWDIPKRKPFSTDAWEAQYRQYDRHFAQLGWLMLLSQRHSSPGKLGCHTYNMQPCYGMGKDADTAFCFLVEAERSSHRRGSRQHCWAKNQRGKRRKRWKRSARAVSMTSASMADLDSSLITVRAAHRVGSL